MKSVKTQGSAVDTDESVVPPLACCIQVTFEDDRTLVADIPMARVAPGDDVIWHTQPGEQRRFWVKVRPRPAGFVAADGDPGAEDDRGIQVLNEGASGQLFLQSSVQQIVRMRVGPHAERTDYECLMGPGMVEDPGIAPKSTGIVVGPPPRPK